MLAVVMALAMYTTAFAVGPETPRNPNLIMYADDFTAGPIVAANFDPYSADTHINRLNPTNALGPFDAVDPVGVSDHFFATAAREWSHFTFEDKFINIDDAPDIEFAEVTWSAWHTEAVKVYLTGAYIKDAEGNVVPYGDTDDGIGYYAGIAWNSTALNAFPPSSSTVLHDIIKSYFPGDRDFADNEFRKGDTALGESTYQTFTQFHLPAEVVYAEGIYLVDITAEVYELAGNGSYMDVGGTGALVTLNSDAWNVKNYSKITAADVIAVPGTNGNTDGYDLDAIRVYRYMPWSSDDSATGYGSPILSKGTWFMYNYYDGSEGTFDLQAGNPKGGINIIGSYTVTNNGDGTFTVDYDIDDTIEANGYVYDIVVKDEHLGISNTMSFKAKPGKDDNQDYGVPFADADGSFYIFAHFSVEYR